MSEVYCMDCFNIPHMSAVHFHALQCPAAPFRVHCGTAATKTEAIQPRFSVCGHIRGALYVLGVGACDGSKVAVYAIDSIQDHTHGRACN